MALATKSFKDQEYELIKSEILKLGLPKKNARYDRCYNCGSSIKRPEGQKGRPRLYCPPKPGRKTSSCARKLHYRAFNIRRIAAGE